MAINRFHTDTVAELNVIQQRCQAMNVAVSLAEHFEKGGAGAIDLAKKVMAVADDKPLRPPVLQM